MAWGSTWALVAPSRAGTAPSPGRGNALAEGVAVLPRQGSLAVGIIFGEALAGHTNSEAKAQSQDIDLGSIGTSLTSSNCGKPPTLTPDQIPQPLLVESGEPNAAKGTTQSDYGGAFSKFGQADVTPYAKSVTVVAPFAIAGVLSVGGGTVTSWSGMVKGERVAGATADVSGITFPGGTSVSALHWEATFPSTGSAKPAGTFSIGHAVINGTAVPTQNAATVLAQLNNAVSPLGFQINQPQVHVTSGIQFVDPLGISVVPNSTRDGVLGGVIAGIQPVRSQAVAALLSAYCQANTGVTVADIAIGSISGAGSFSLLFGGAQASSGEVAANTFNLNLPALGAGGVELGSTPGTDGTGSTDAGAGALPSATGQSGTGAALASSGTAQTGPVAGAGGTLGPIGQIGLIKGKRGGALAAVGLGGLALIAALAEGDRRMMRRAQRVIHDFED